MKDHIHLLQCLLMEELNEQQKNEIDKLLLEDAAFKKDYQLIISLKKAVKINILKDKMKYLEFVESSLAQLHNAIEHDRVSIKKLIYKIRKQMNIYLYVFLVYFFNYDISIKWNC